MINYVKACNICQQIKVIQDKPVGFMNRRERVRPWHTVAGDFVGPMPISKNRNEYLLVFQDLYTRYIEVVATRKADGKTVARLFKEKIIGRYGPPVKFLTDLGTEFVNQTVDSLLDEWKIEHVTTPGFHAQSNPVERVNRVIKTMISAYLVNDHRNWDENLVDQVLAFNTAKHESTNISPAMLVLGYQPENSPSMRREAEKEDTEEMDQEFQRSWYNERQKQRQIQQLAEDNQNEAFLRQKKYYDKRRRDQKFYVGDKVRKKNRVLSNAAKGISAKFAPEYGRVYTIITKLGSDVYELADEKGIPDGKVHAKDLKLISRADRNVTNEVSSDSNYDGAAAEENLPEDQEEICAPKGGVRSGIRGRKGKKYLVVQPELSCNKSVDVIVHDPSSGLNNVRNITNSNSDEADESNPLLLRRGRSRNLPESQQHRVISHDEIAAREVASPPANSSETNNNDNKASEPIEKRKRGRPPRTFIRSVNCDQNNEPKSKMVLRSAKNN